MCMLTFVTPHTMPDADALRNGTATNRDGHGYAIVVPGQRKMIVRHSLDADRMIERFVADRAKYPSGPALFHSRFGTSGTGGKFNCHPFYVGGDKRTVVAHNGVLPAYMQPSPKDKRCDTRLAADDIFSKYYGHLSKPWARKRLGAAIGANNKLVFLTTNPQYPSSAYIVNESSGIWDEGIWYSNRDYIGCTAPALAQWWTDDVGFYAEDKCPLCGYKDVIDEPSQVCTACESCLDCFQQVGACDCYYPHPAPADAEPDAEPDTDADRYAVLAGLWADN